MVFVGGPRQVGKTVFARDVVGGRFSSVAFYNWDRLADRRNALRCVWPGEARLIVLDEYHKYPKWKNWLKGEFDTAGPERRFLLTGSARLNVYRKGGDSLQGRYHYHTLFPFSVAELSGKRFSGIPGQPLTIGGESSEHGELGELLKFGGFPEPFLRGEDRFWRRWNRERLERFFQEDIRDLTRIRDLGSLALLADLLPPRAGSVLSLNSLAEDLQVNFRTVSHWVEVFENLYHCFRVSPYQTRQVAAVRKAKKLYLWDWSEISDPGHRLENLVAVHLSKFSTCLQESEGYDVRLHFLRDQTGREVDFLLTADGKPWIAVEVKASDEAPSRNLLYFKQCLAIPHAFQVCPKTGLDLEQQGVRRLSLDRFLAALV
ncbi:MAG: ATP-binding protein [Acidobacteria bacterium]|nr:ATP-binding protein [Acidobacteriota bacterium]